MEYLTLLNLPSTDFKRFVGVHHATFQVMPEIIEETYRRKYRRRGRIPKNSVGNFLLMTLLYFHTAQLSVAKMLDIK
ncbi:MAG: hypothetical protein L0G01_09600 [Lactococcus lactis]|nr:hypothetical protein [Lactococcus lactis]